jgi:uncharacterized membrane protein YozB (DUF420 family)
LIRNNLQYKVDRVNYDQNNIFFEAKKIINEISLLYIILLKLILKKKKKNYHMKNLYINAKLNQYFIFIYYFIFLGQV